MRDFLQTGAEPHYVDAPTEAEKLAEIERFFAAPRQGRVPPTPKWETASRNSTQPACTTDACAQGRKTCPTPQSCRRPEPPPTGRHVPPAESRQHRLRGVAAVLGVPVAVVLLIAALDEAVRFFAR